MLDQDLFFPFQAAVSEGTISNAKKFTMVTINQ